MRIKWLYQFVLITVLVAASKPIYANLQTEETPYFINEGTIYTPNNLSIAIVTLNSSMTFHKVNQPIGVENAVAHKIKIMNNTATIKYFVSSNSKNLLEIAPKNSAVLDFSNLDTQLSHYYIISRNKKDTLAGGLILTEENFNPKAKNYFWNFSNYKSSTISKDTFDFQTINNQFYPEVLSDISARLNLSIGDTAYIYAINTGINKQIFHIHGFHLYILYNSASKIINHIYKDTFVLAPNETLKLQFIADKKGTYSINRLNYTPSYSNNYLPNGMFMTFKINE